MCPSVCIGEGDTKTDTKEEKLPRCSAVSFAWWLVELVKPTEVELVVAAAPNILEREPSIPEREPSIPEPVLHNRELGLYCGLVPEQDKL